jgi:hypothetical protein
MSRGKWKPRRANGSVLEAFRHGRYNVRDQLGHYVKPESQADHPCHHHCCRGERVHPKNLPVKLDRSYLRSLSPDELDTELGQYTRFIDTHEAGFLQVVAEFDRRDESARTAAARKERARERRQHRESEYKDEVYRQWLTAEAETNGYMLNRAGKAAGIDERTLFTGPESRVAKYASRELLDFFDTHPRPTRAALLGSAYERRAHLAGRRVGASADR